MHCCCVSVSFTVLLQAAVEAEVAAQRQEREAAIAAAAAASAAAAAAAKRSSSMIDAASFLGSSELDDSATKLHRRSSLDAADGRKVRVCYCSDHSTSRSCTIALSVVVCGPRHIV
jgi:hypothetical protein